MTSVSAQNVTVTRRVEPKVVSDRIGHANMAYTLTIYTHRSTGRDRPAAEGIAGLIFGEQWMDPAG
jgi:hypothetical protein